MTLPTETVNYLYDGSGTRVATQSTANGSTTLTSYIGSIEEVQTTGSSTQTTTYYTVGGKRVAADVNGTFYYFGYDALGSQVAILDASGNLVGAQLYGPYGASRYNTGTLPTSIGFTGQRADSITGLDYYNARYYDPGVGSSCRWIVCRAMRRGWIRMPMLGGILRVGPIPAGTGSSVEILGKAVMMEVQRQPRAVGPVMILINHGLDQGVEVVLDRGVGRRRNRVVIMALEVLVENLQRQSALRLKRIWNNEQQLSIARKEFWH